MFWQARFSLNVLLLAEDIKWKIPSEFNSFWKMCSYNRIYMNNFWVFNLLRREWWPMVMKINGTSWRVTQKIAFIRKWSTNKCVLITEELRFSIRQIKPRASYRLTICSMISILRVASRHTIQWKEPSYGWIMFFNENFWTIIIDITSNRNFFVFPDLLSFWVRMHFYLGPKGVLKSPFQQSASFMPWNWQSSIKSNYSRYNKKHLQFQHSTM